MKKLLVTTALSLFSFGAVAADQPSRVAAPAPVFVVAPSWTGFYLGVQGGYGWGEQQTKYYKVNGTLAGDHGSDEINGGLIGGTVGYNHQLGSLVLGVEGDLSASWIKGKSSGVSSDPCLLYTGSSFTATGGYCQTDINWLGTARLRAGVAVGSALLYLTGGLAFGEVGAARPFTGVANSWTQTRTGWTVGAGVEYAVSSNWSVKAEYLYVNLGNDYTYPCPACTSDNHRVEVDTQLARVGINYRFGGSASPVVARY